MRPEYLYAFNEDGDIIDYYTPIRTNIIQDGYICFYDEDPIPVEED